jgi:hypothetical protein
LAYAVGFDGIPFGTVAMFGKFVATDWPRMIDDPTIGPANLDDCPMSTLPVA